MATTRLRVSIGITRRRGIATFRVTNCGGCSRPLSVHPNQQAANAVRLLLLTGSRRGEVLAATWQQFDLEAGIWVKPSAHTKQKREHRVPLSAPARQLLAEIKTAAERRAAEKKREHSCYVFPIRGGDGPMVEIKKPGRALRGSRPKKRPAP